jgi:hypothetical protein
VCLSLNEKGDKRLNFYPVYLRNAYNGGNIAFGEESARLIVMPIFTDDISQCETLTTVT